MCWLGQSRSRPTAYLAEEDQGEVLSGREEDSRSGGAAGDSGAEARLGAGEGRCWTCWGRGSAEVLLVAGGGTRPKRTTRDSDFYKGRDVNSLVFTWSEIPPKHLTLRNGGSTGK
jgi:hypothetical protein